ncbi:MAG: DUF4837 family protein [Bacteroidales bacterium]|jgi:hypothetical protein|nr:DUF4837 family protein [Bacteroidales bacterium]
MLNKLQHFNRKGTMNIRNGRKVLIFTICLLIFTSCGKRFIVEHYSTGKAGEIILILDSKQSSDFVRNYIEKTLMQPQPALNQIEPMFDLLRLENKDLNSYFQRHRSILQFEIDSNSYSNTISFEENVWAKPQVYIFFRGNSMDSLLLLFQQNENEIINILYENDLRRVISYALENNDAFIEKRIKERFGIFITVPKNYRIAREEKDFIWLCFRTARNDRFIMIYRTSGLNLSRESLIAVRNDKTKAYIPGAVLSAYPIVAEIEPFPLYTESVGIGPNTGAELRGLWETVGDKMGGPFYNFSFICSSSNQTISVDGFVYAPTEDKRNYLREVEAIVKTVR